MPLCVLHFLYPNLPVSQQIGTRAQLSVLSLLYPTVLCLLPGEILLLECQILWLDGAWLSIKGLESVGCMKQLPFPLHHLAHPRAWFISASWASAQLSQLCASGRTLVSCWPLFLEVLTCSIAHGTDAVMAKPVAGLYLCFPLTCLCLTTFQ